MNVGKADVFGLQVNRQGGMHSLAKMLLWTHCFFVVVYALTAIISLITISSTNAASKESQESLSGYDKEHEMEGEGDFTLVMNYQWKSGLIGSFVVLMLVWWGIKVDNRDILGATMLCDGSCAVCNCCSACIGIMVVFFIFAVLSVVDEFCTCSTSEYRTPTSSPNYTFNYVPCDVHDPCDVCFDKDKCLKDVEFFKSEASGGANALIFWIVMICLEMCCCMFAATQLSKAHTKMAHTPFCRQALPAYVPGQVVVGSPVMGQPVVGQQFVTVQAWQADPGPSKEVNPHKE